jgi:hypothetical protein
VALAALAVLAPATPFAQADQPPAFTAGPTIAGDAAVGTPLKVVAAWTGVPTPTPLYEWQRCDATGAGCDVVPSACSATYVPSFDDFGHRLVARVDLFSTAGVARARTPPSDLVLGAPGAPTRPAPPAVCTAISPPPPPAPPPPPPVPTGAASGHAAFLQPFPVVRIRGYAVHGGMRITLLSVRGPRSARVSAQCVGAGCPRHRLAPLALPVRLRTFERYLRAGTVLRLRITAATAIGKYTSFRIRAHGAPRRRDRCLLPDRWAPARCPLP